MTRKRWTEEEDEILVQSIKDCPHNRLQACKNASKKLGRSWKCCNARWYNALSNPEHPKYVGIIFLSVNRKSRYDNRVVYKYDSKVKPVKSNLWSKIKRFLGIN